MIKRIMVGLFALSVAALWVSEANALLIIKRKSVGVEVTSNQGGATFVADIFGLPEGDLGCGLIQGDVYCLSNADGVDPEACDKSTGYSAALVLVTDIDFIKPKTKPYLWSDWELNSDITDFGQRRQLRVMEQLDASNEFTITLPAGEAVNKAGILAISDAVVEYWEVNGASTPNTALRNYVGKDYDIDGILEPTDGFGINGEEYLQALPGAGLIPIFGEDLKNLEGHVVCFVSHTDNVNGDDLHGKYRGTFGAKVLSTTTNSVTMEVLDADDVCTLTLYNDYLSDPPGETLQTGCSTDEKTVFAPAPCGNEPYLYDAYEAKQGTIICDEVVCEGSVELELSPNPNDLNGIPLCPSNTTFKKFIPKNLGEGEYADYAFIGVVKESTDPNLNQQVICGDIVEGDVKYSRYGCVPLETVLNPPVVPDCCECVDWEQVP